jgi:LysM repeat protein/lysophospholipase L1-like esterase
MQKLAFSCLFLLLLITTILPKRVVSQPYVEKYSFIQTEQNVISNHIRGMKDFYGRLEELKAGRIRTVNIVHIGDSHIQADWFSGKLRLLLQEEFGSAGRGLVFPYDLAFTNGPDDIESRSPQRWSSQRNSLQNNRFPTGISGYALQKENSWFSIKLTVDEEMSGMDYGFNKVTLFTQRGTNFSDWKVNDFRAEYKISRPSVIATTSDPKGMKKSSQASIHIIKEGENLTLIANKYGLTVSELKKLNDLDSDLIYPGHSLKVAIDRGQGGSRGESINRDITSSTSTRDFMQQFYLPYPTLSISMEGTSNSKTARLYGVVLENYHQSGILYHSIGVNGAKFEHYNESKFFHEQLMALKPDLIIISLGTNEAVNGYFNGDSFSNQVDELIHDLEQHNRFANILVTTPPDSYRKNSVPNPNVEKISDALTTYALRNNLASWDFFQVMGGMGSVQAWHQYYLAQDDRLHLTKRGYELQAQLLFDALMKGYESYKNRR